MRVVHEMDLANSHGGFAGKSLADKMRDDLDEAYQEWKDDEGTKDYWTGFCEGICQALGVLRGSSCDAEWELMEARYQERVSCQQMQSTPQQLNPPAGVFSEPAIEV